MITVHELTKYFGKFKALNTVSVTFASGTCVALIGPNGSGKTTLIKCILGMVLPDSGQIELNNKPVSVDWRYRNDIGYMPQNGMFPENMTVGQVLDMMRDIRRTASEDLDLYSEFQIQDILHKKMRALSGGTKQKVNATLAFMFNPAVLILDEPTAGLDPVASEILKEKIGRAKRDNKLVLITSHILSDLDELVSDVAYIQDGTIHFSKSIAQLKTDTGAKTLSAAIANFMRQTC